MSTPSSTESSERNEDVENKLESFKYVKRELPQRESSGNPDELTPNITENAPLLRRSKRQRIELKLESPKRKTDTDSTSDVDITAREESVPSAVPPVESVSVSPEDMKRLTRDYVVIPEEMPARYRPSKGFRTKITPPDHWKQHHANIFTMRSQSIAPVDTMGCERCFDDKADAVTRRWQILVGLVLSSQTRDETNHAAVHRLIALNGCTVHAIAEMDTTDLEQILKPVSFYRVKAKNLKTIAQTCIDRYDGDIPKTVAEIVEFPGVGPKMAYLCTSAAWNTCTGIGVDVHVHRISNRLKWVKTTTPIQTQLELEAWLPKEYWSNLNILLVGFGQTICLPQRPKCGECLNRNICPASTAKDKKQRV